MSLPVQFLRRYRQARKVSPQAKLTAQRRREDDAARKREDATAARSLWRALARICDPGEICTVDVWAEKNLRLSLAESRMAGPLRFDATPYLRGACLATTLPQYRRVLLVFASQTGKTLVLFVFGSYVVHNDPGPMMFAFHTQSRSKKTMKRLVRMVRDNPVVAGHVAGGRNAVTLGGVSFDRMEWLTAWSGSPSSLASDPIRYLVRDETDKWEHVDKDEGHPLDTSASRVVSYGEIAKIVDATTPALDSDDAQRGLNEGTCHEYYVPCPHCGKPDLLADVAHFEPRRTVDELAERLKAAGYQTIEFENFDGWKDTTDEAAIKANTVCRCIHCGQTWRHDRTLEITHWTVAKWIPKRAATNLCSMRLPAWYRAVESCSYGAIMWEYVSRKLDPSRLQQWYNEKAALAWKQMGVEKSRDDIRKHCRGYARDTIPFIPTMIFLTVDIRDNEIHAVFRAWGPHETSALLRYEILVRETNFRPNAEPSGETLRQIDPLLQRTFRCAVDGELYSVDLCGIDSGYQPDEVYEFCRRRERCIAMKGDDAVKQTLVPSRPQRNPITKEPLPDSCLLVSFNATTMTDRLYTRLAVTEGSPGDWMLYADVGQDYLDQIIANRKEKKVNRWGREEWRYVRFENRPDHLLDCEKEQYALAQLTGVGEIKPEHAAKPAEPAAAPNFIGREMGGFMDRFSRR